MGVSRIDYSGLLAALQGGQVTKRPVILPDFFLDHFVMVEDFETFIKNLKELAAQGGGNLLGSHQFVRRGGNSVNTASALHSLGLDPCLIVTTDLYGQSLLRALVPPSLDLKHVHTDGALSSTVSIEANYGTRRVNLMISDSGSAAAFEFSDLTDLDLLEIRDAGLVALLNLNHNRSGVGLAKELFAFTRSQKQAVNFLDIGDPSSRPDFVEPLAKDVLSHGLVDILGVNENEACWFAWALSGRNERWRKAVSDEEQWLCAAEFISAELSLQVELHTPYYAASVRSGSVIAVPTFSYPSKVMCGAGDAWNAGCIFGSLLGLGTKDRLILSNIVAALYISSDDATHPEIKAIIDALAQNPALDARGEKLLKLKC
jgi:sugar/nucleoside kinase (ribokinase family)